MLFPPWLAKNAPGLSSSTISRLKAVWEQDLHGWQKRDLSDKSYAYFWVDGIYCNVRMDDKQCLLVVIGATEDGRKELIAIDGGLRESELSWAQLLIDLQSRGLKNGPSYVLVTAPWVFGKPLPKHTLIACGSGVGCIKRPISSINYQRAFKARPNKRFMKSGILTASVKPNDC